MSVDVIGYLQSKGLDLKRSDATNIHTPCFFCNEEQNKRGRLYINIDDDAEIPGLFKCFLCDERGSLISIKRHFGDPVNEKEEVGEEMFRIFKVAAAYYHDALADNEDAFSWLRGQERGLSVETIVEAQLGFAEAGNGLFRELRQNQGFSLKEIIATGLIRENKSTGKFVDSLQNMVTIPYFVAGNCVGIRGRAFPYDEKSGQPKYKTCGGTKSRLFNSDAVWHTDEVVICEGEFDALALGQIGVPAVGVPGARNWQEHWDGYMVDMRRLWLAFDPDKTGQDGAKKIKDRHGARVKEVTLHHNGKAVDVTDWLVGGHTLAEFEEAKKAALVGGLLITVDEALSEHEEVQGLDGVKFGNEELDHWLSPGLLVGQLLVVLAKAGTGKTVWLLNTMHRMKMVPGQEKLRFLFVSLEQTRGEWWERARRIHRFYNLEATDKDALDYWRDSLLIIDKNRVTPDDLNSALDDYEYRMGGKPDCVFVDYLGYWARSFKGEGYQRSSDAVMSLKEIAKERRLAIVAPHQVSRVAKYGEEPDADAARDSGVIEETADFLFILWSPDAQQGKSDEEKSGVVHLKIGKSRHGGRGVKLNYQFAPISLTLIPHFNTTDEKLLKRARDELRYEQEYRDKWEQAVYRHRTGIEGHLEPNPGYQEKLV